MNLAVVFEWCRRVAASCLAVQTLQAYPSQHNGHATRHSCLHYCSVAGLRVLLQLLATSGRHRRSKLCQRHVLHRQPVDRDCDPAHGLQLSCRRFATHLANVTGGFERRLGVLRDGRSSDEPILHDSGSGDSSALIAAPYPVTALLYTTSCQVTRESTIDHQVDPVFCGARTLQRPFTARPTGWATR